MRVLAVLTLMVVPLAACGDDDADASCDPEAAAEAAPEDLPSDLPDIVCDTVEEAEDALAAAGYSLRVAEIDGEPLMLTLDFVETRVNVAVETQGDESIVVGILSLG